MRRHQHRLERLLHAALEALAVPRAQLVQLQQPLDLRARHGPAIRAARKRADDLARDLRRGVLRGALEENAPMRFRHHLRGGLGRAFEFEMMHVHRAFLLLAGFPLRGFLGRKARLVAQHNQSQMMFARGQTKLRLVMPRRIFIRLDFHLLHDVAIAHEREHQRVRAGGLGPRERAEEILAVARGHEIKRHVVLLDAVERDPAVAALLRVVAHEQQVRQKPHHGVRRRLDDLDPLDHESPRLAAAARVLRRGVGIHERHFQFVLARAQLHRQHLHVRQIRIAAHLDGFHHFVIHADFHLRRLRSDVTRLRREPQPMLARARDGKFRDQRLRPRHAPRRVRTGRVVAALELPRRDALRRGPGRLGCLGRIEKFQQLDGQPARILGPRARRAVERIEQAKRERVAPGIQRHLELDRGGRFERAVDGRCFHEVAVHPHLHSCRLLAGDAFRGVDAQAVRAGLHRAEAHRRRTLRDHAHRAGRADVGFHRPVERLGVQTGGPDARRGRSDDRLRENLVRRGEIFLEQHRRHREHVADVVETVARVVRRKIIGGPEIHADEIANRVVVLGAIQAANRDAAGIGVFAIRFENLEINPRLHQFALGQCGLLFFVRRGHFAIAEIHERLLPELAILEQFRRRFVGIELDAALLRAVRVAVVAILLEQRQHVLLIPNLRRILRRRPAKQRRHARGNHREPHQTG